MLGKKIISISLVGALMLQSTTNLFASDILQDAFHNKTPAKSFQVKDSNGNTVKTMFYSGGYYFRFNNDNPPQPLWTFSPPEIEAGCNGFNLKGMFMSLLGLDQFGAMLQNAGTSLAWGVAVGLIYSLPGVASVFKMINQWAKDIQKLLSMSCQAGIAIGQAIGDKVGKGYNKENLEKSLKFGMDGDEVSEYAQKGINTLIKDKMGLDGVNFDWDSGFNFGGDGDASTDKKKDALASPLNDLFGDYSVGGSMFFDYILGSQKTMDAIKAVVGAEKSPLFYKRITIDYNSGDGAFDAKGVLEESIDSIQANTVDPLKSKNNGMKFFSYALYYNFAGDLGYSSDVADLVIKNMGDTFMCSSANDTTPPNCDATKKANNDKILFEKLKDPKFKVKATPVGNLTTVNGVQLKNLILNGYTDETKDFVRNLVAPEFLIISGKETNKVVNNFITTPTEPSTKKSFFGNHRFAGAKVVSQCSLYKTLKGSLKDSYIEDLNQTGVQGVTCDSIPVTIFDGIDVYADILYKAKDSEIAEGIKKIQHVNAFLTTRAILDELASYLNVRKIGTTKLKNDLLQTTPSNSVHIVNNNASEILKTLENYSKVISDAKAQLDNDYPNARQGVEGLQKYFKELDKNIQIRTNKIMK